MVNRQTGEIVFVPADTSEGRTRCGAIHHGIQYDQQCMNDAGHGGRHVRRNADGSHHFFD